MKFLEIPANMSTRLEKVFVEGKGWKVTFYNPKKGKMISSYTQIHEAWDASVKCNPENLPPPNRLLATTDESKNNENEVTEQNVPLPSHLFVHEDQQSPGSEGSGRSERTENIHAAPAHVPYTDSPVPPVGDLSTDSPDVLSPGQRRIVNAIDKVFAHSVKKAARDMTRDIQGSVRMEGERSQAGLSRLQRTVDAEAVESKAERKKQETERDEAGAARVALLQRLAQEQQEKDDKELADDALALKKQQADHALALAETKKALAKKTAKMAARSAERETDQLRRDQLAATLKEVGAAVAGQVSEVIEAIKEVKNVVDNTNEAAALAAEAAVIGADASKDTKDAVEALASTFEEKVRVLLLREKTIQSMIEGPEDVNEPQSTKDYQTVIKQELAVIQKSITDLGQQRATANQRNSAPAPAPTTRSGATRNGAATATRNGAATTTRKQPAPRERLPVLKGELAKQIRLAVAALASNKQDGAYLEKITALSKVPQLLLLAQQEDQLLPALAALVKGITTYLVDQKAANESQLITATLAAIYAIYSSLEANSKEMELVAVRLVPPLLKATEKKVQGARAASTQFGKTVVALVGLAAPSERVLESMLSKLDAKELTGDHECLWTANALGSYVRATPQQVEPATPEMYRVSQGLLQLLEHKSDQVRDAAISSVCDLAKVNKGLAISLAETKHMNKQLAEKLGKAVKAATAHYTAVELGSPLSS